MTIQPILAKFRWAFLVVGIFSGVANLIMLMPTIYMLQVFDRVLLSGSEMTLLIVSLLTLGLFALMALAEWFRTQVLVRAGVRFDDELSSRVFDAVFSSYLRRRHENPSRAFADLTELRHFITGRGILTFFDAPWTPIYLGVLFLLHPQLGWLAIGFIVVQSLIARLGHSRQLAPSETAAQSQADETRYLQAKLRGTDVIEALGMAQPIFTAWRRRHRKTLADQESLQSLSTRVTAVSGFFRYFQQSLSLGFGAWLVIQGEITAGAMIAANILTSRALAPVDQLVGNWKSFLSARGAYRRLTHILQSTDTDLPELSRMAPTGELTLRQVFVHAPGRAEPILHDINLSFPPGTVTVVLGPSGSGKSTLARALIGVWPVQSGELLLDGRPLSIWSREELGPYLGYLPQEIELFDGTVAENISRFGPLDPNEVVRAARAAGLHDMILRMPLGYDTPVGESAGSLSGGQRQRVALARAVFGSPRLIVLDEPNANLDDQGEQALMAAVRFLKEGGATVVLISHRPQVLNGADRVVFLNQGRVTASGPRDAVLAALSTDRKEISA
jgi:ATP-binding cassette subfamily C exporter for protease/lipase